MRKTICIGALLGAFVLLLSFSAQAEQNHFPVDLQFTTSKGAALEGARVLTYQNGWTAAGYTDQTGRLSFTAKSKTVQIRIEFEDGRSDSSHDVSHDSRVFIQTLPLTTQFLTSDGRGIQGARIRRLRSTWTDMGYTGNDGRLVNEMLPGDYQFRVEWKNGRYDVRQDVSENPLLDIRAIQTAVSFTDASGNGLSGARVRRLRSDWVDLGYTDENGRLLAEILPGAYTFRLNWDNGEIDLKQNIEQAPNDRFQTVKVMVHLKNANGEGFEGGLARKLRSTWLDMGYTDASGALEYDVLPGLYTFRMQWNNCRMDIKREIRASQVILFETLKTDIYT